MDTASNSPIVRTATMPTPAIPASVQALQAYENAPHLEAAVSAAERSMSPGLG